MAGIGDLRLPIFPAWPADGHWKELPHHFFNRPAAAGQSPIINHQSPITDHQLKPGLRLRPKAAL
jgi:hypothetical protein